MRYMVVAALVLALLPGSAAAGTPVEVRRGLAYGSAPGLVDGRTRTLRLDVYRSVRTPRRAAPAILWVHGGGFYEGTRDEMRDYARSMARRGWVALSVGYRLSTRAQLRRRGRARALRAAQHDVQAAVRWTRRRAAGLGVDPNRVYAGGFSAGAYTALRVGARAGDPGSSGNPGFPSGVAGVVAVAGGGDPAALDGGDPPALLLHGTRDRLVPYRRSVDTLAAYRRAGVPCRLISFPGVGHELGALRVAQRLMPHVARWLAAR